MKAGHTQSKANGGPNAADSPPILVRDIVNCKTCGLRFMAVDWLAWRVEGYCSKACRPWRDEPAGKEKQ